MDNYFVRDDVGASRPLFAPLEFQLATQAVLAGSAFGTIWVNEHANPELALMKVGHRLYLAGDSQQVGTNLEGLTHLIYDQLLPEARLHGADGFLLYYSEPGWEELLPATVFDGRTVYPGRRNYYELNVPGAHWKPLFMPDLPEGVFLQPVTPGLLVQTSLVHYDAFLEEMQSERESVDDFMSRSFGTVVVSQNAIIGWCLSEYNLEERCEIGIATDETYRRQGLATLAGIEMIRQGLARGIRRVGWHCWLRNEGSNATARKLGFEHVNEHGAYFVPA